mgnify:CR=1 FL=1
MLFSEIFKRGLAVTAPHRRPRFCKKSKKNLNRVILDRVPKFGYLPKAKLAFRERLRKEFPIDQYPDVPHGEIGKALLKCTTAALKAKPQRIVNINVYAYEGDDAPTYGEALRDPSIEFFFKQRDAPTLSSELKKHRSQLDKLLECTETQFLPPRAMTDRFQKNIAFFEESQEAASQGDEAAKAFLEACNAITAMNKQWKTILWNTGRR